MCPRHTNRTRRVKNGSHPEEYLWPDVFWELAPRSQLVDRSGRSLPTKESRGGPTEPATFQLWLSRASLPRHPQYHAEIPRLPSALGLGSWSGLATVIAMPWMLFGFGPTSEQDLDSVGATTPHILRLSCRCGHAILTLDVCGSPAVVLSYRHRFLSGRRQPALDEIKSYLDCQQNKTSPLDPYEMRFYDGRYSRSVELR